MFEFLSKLSAKREAVATTDYGRYRQLIAKTATAELSASDVTALADLMKSLNLSDADLERDAIAVSEHRKAAAAVADYENAQAAKADAQAAGEKWESESKQIIEQRLITANQLLRAIEETGRRFEAAAIARGKALELAAEHWRLLGLPDPAEREKIKHLAHQFRDQEFPESVHDYFSFEAVIARPSAFIAGLNSHFPHAIFDDFTMVTAPGQSQGELDELLAIARERIGDAMNPSDPARERLMPSYLLTDGDQPGFPIVATYANIVNVFAPTLAAVQKVPPEFNPTKCRWLLHPGQPVADFRRMVAALDKAWKENRANVATARAKEQADAERRHHYQQSQDEPNPQAAFGIA